MAPTCTRNVEDPRFECECFDNDPNPEENCPREDCSFNTTPNEGICTPPRPGEPGECKVDDGRCPDPTKVCVDGVATNPSGNLRCSPLTGSYGTRFGCCKSMSFIMHFFLLIFRRLTKNKKTKFVF